MNSKKTIVTIKRITMQKTSFQKKIITLATMLALVMLCPISAWSQASKYETAAAAGDAEAQYQLGMCYYSDYYLGQGVDEDMVQAFEWFRKAAEQGHAGAQFSLGTCYYSGLGVAEDIVQGIEWYRKAAEQGNADAQYNLGVFYYTGTDVPKDEALGLKLLRQAAEQGNISAQEALKQFEKFQ